MDKQKRKRILDQVKLDRAARRAVELESGTPRVNGKVFLTSKKDRERRRNNIKNWD